jgi:hypothetical protein
MKNNNFIEKIKDRVVKNLKVAEVYPNTLLNTETIKYLKKQNYLDFSKIEIILQNHFVTNYPIGYVIKNENNDIIGFMGTIFSIKHLDNKDQVFCNIHTWIVNKEHRLNSYLLLVPLIEKKIVLTAFTPVKTLVGLLEKFGFEKIKMKYRLIFLFNFFTLINKDDFIIETNSHAIKKILDKHDLQIYENYIDIPCEKFTIINKNDTSKYIFIIGSKVKKKMFTVLNLFYVSNRKEMKKNWNIIKKKISKEFNLSFCGQFFFEELHSAIPNHFIISKSLNKEVCIKNLQSKSTLDILYSDLIGQI